MSSMFEKIKDLASDETWEDTEPDSDEPANATPDENDPAPDGPDATPDDDGPTPHWNPFDFDDDLDFDFSIPDEEDDHVAGMYQHFSLKKYLMRVLLSTACIAAFFVAWGTPICLCTQLGIILTPVESIVYLMAVSAGFCLLDFNLEEDDEPLYHAFLSIALAVMYCSLPFFWSRGERLFILVIGLLALEVYLFNTCSLFSVMSPLTRMRARSEVLPFAALAFFALAIGLSILLQATDATSFSTERLMDFMTSLAENSKSHPYGGIFQRM